MSKRHRSGDLRTPTVELDRSSTVVGRVTTWASTPSSLGSESCREAPDVPSTQLCLGEVQGTLTDTGRWTSTRGPGPETCQASKRGGRTFHLSDVQTPRPRPDRDRHSLLRTEELRKSQGEGGNQETLFLGGGGPTLSKPSATVGHRTRGPRNTTRSWKYKRRAKGGPVPLA